MTQQSTVSEDTHPYLHAWDSRVRTYNQFFQAHTTGARDDLNKLKRSSFSNWKDVTQRQDRY